MLSKNKIICFAAFFLISILFLLTFSSILDDTFTFDETAHVVAGYSYIVKKDMRLNPEHPPLIKDLAAIPLTFLDLNFPESHSAWEQKAPPAWWHQFDLGTEFLYRSNNDPDQILLFSRIPMIVVTIITAVSIFFFAQSLFDQKTALLSLFLFVLSPTILAHGRLVTTDMGAALGILVSTYFFLKALKKPVKKNIILAGIFFGLAQLMKFTAIFLVPFFGILTLVWAFLRSNQQKKDLIKKTFTYCLLLTAVFIVGGILIWLVYGYHVLDYSIERQVRDMESILSSNSIKAFGQILPKMAEIKILRPCAQYLLGLAMVLQRGSGGNTTYFLGEISAVSWKSYFPFVYLVKEPLAFHVLTIIAMLTSSCLVFKNLLKKPLKKDFIKRLKLWLNSHFTEFALLFFICFYWMITLAGNLNIGVRHLLPIFPFIILLVSKAIINWLKPPYLKIKYVVLVGLLLWQAISVILIYPHFLAYFNELVGGPNNGHLVVVDSNLDWGQDLKRLEKWMEENKVEKIYLDYFGGGNPEYYLGAKYFPWHGTKEQKEIARPAYLAVSANHFQGGRAKAGTDFDQPTGYYFWLDEEQLITKIGYSIFVYYID